LLAKHYLASGALDRHLPRLRGAYRTRAQQLGAAITTQLGAEVTGFDPPQGGMFGWLALRSGLDTEPLVARAVEHGVVFVPGRAFFPDPPEVNTMRLTFASASAAQLAAGVTRLAAALADHGDHCAH
jgi:2-aminoadipate transaminase